MKKQTPFYSELILPPNSEYKVKDIHEQKPSLGAFQILSSEPQSVWGEKNFEMIGKIVGLCGADINSIPILNIDNELDIVNQINDSQTETLLCFVPKSIIQKLNFKPSNKGFTSIMNKKIIFLPEVSVFADNQKAKKYLWDAIKTTFPQ